MVCNVIVLLFLRFFDLSPLTLRLNFKLQFVTFISVNAKWLLILLFSKPPYNQPTQDTLLLLLFIIRIVHVVQKRRRKNKQTKLLCTN